MPGRFSSTMAWKFEVQIFNVAENRCYNTSFASEYAHWLRTSEFAHHTNSKGELELELIQTHMAQKPVLRVEVGARFVAQSGWNSKGGQTEIAPYSRTWRQPRSRKVLVTDLLYCFWSTGRMFENILRLLSWLVTSPWTWLRGNFCILTPCFGASRWPGAPDWAIF